jgi:hypothetical protein
MSGPGDIDGEVSGDEAAWRDLIAHFDDPAGPEISEAPWPASENVTDPARDPARDSGSTTGTGTGTGLHDSVGGAGQAPAPEVAGGAGQAPAADETAGHGERPSDMAGIFIPLDRTRVVRHAGGPRSYSPPEDEDEDERYVPPPLPPPGKLDSVSKGAWLAVVGGPAYLVIAGLFLHWSISATAAFIAIAAFVGGFVTLVVKLGDHPRRDDDDDGAVL